MKMITVIVNAIMLMSVNHQYEYDNIYNENKNSHGKCHRIDEPKHYQE